MNFFPVDSQEFGVDVHSQQEPDSGFGNPRLVTTETPLSPHETFLLKETVGELFLQLDPVAARQVGAAVLNEYAQKKVFHADKLHDGKKDGGYAGRQVLVGFFALGGASDYQISDKFPKEINPEDVPGQLRELAANVRAALEAGDLQNSVQLLELIRNQDDSGQLQEIEGQLSLLRGEESLVIVDLPAEVTETSEHLVRSTIRTRLKISIDLVNRLIEDGNIQPKPDKINGRDLDTYPISDVKRMLDKVPVAAEEDRTDRRLADELGTDVGVVRTIRRQNKISKQYRRNHSLKGFAPHIIGEDVDKVRTAYHNTPVAADNEKSYADMARAAGVNTNTILNRMTDEEESQARIRRRRIKAPPGPHLLDEIADPIIERVRHNQLPAYLIPTASIPSIAALSTAGIRYSLGEEYDPVYLRLGQGPEKACHPWAVLEKLVGRHDYLEGVPEIYFDKLPKGPDDRNPDRIAYARYLQHKYATDAIRKAGVIPEVISLQVEDGRVVIGGEDSKLNRIHRTVIGSLVDSITKDGRRRPKTIDGLYFMEYPVSLDTVPKIDMKKYYHRQFAHALWYLVDLFNERYGQNTVIEAAADRGFLRYAVSSSVFVEDLRTKPDHTNNTKNKDKELPTIEFYPPDPAKCVDEDTKDAFIVGERHEEEFEGQYDEKVAIAKALCAVCPFLDPCRRQYAELTPYGYENGSIVAGMTHEEVLAYRLEHNIKTGVTLARRGVLAKQEKEPDRSVGYVRQAKRH